MMETKADAPLEEEDEDESGEAGCECCDPDEEDPLAEPVAQSEKEPETALAAPAEEAEQEQTEQEDSDSGVKATPSKKQRTNKTASSRLEELSRPRPVKEEPAPSSPVVSKKPEKQPVKNRPPLLARLRPTNLEEAWEAFQASGFQEAPKFKYSHSDEYVTRCFEENSNVCFELMPEAKRILQKVHDEYGGPEAFMAQLYGTRKIPAEEMRGIVYEYLKEHNIEDKVDIRLVDGMLSAANVLKPGSEEKYIVNIANGPMSWNMVQGICDHEVGTHLLRMMNDEHQVWHGIRDRYKMGNPWTTEEGFATLNTYQSMPCRLMYPQALRYYAVCRGAQSGFVELFNELMGHISDPKKCWQMCCRIKRGMIDTSLPGAFYLDQAYFKGAVEILRHLDEVDFGRLYGGQIALQDLDKVHFLLRKEVVRLPKFLNSAETLKTYKAHCRRLIKENCIEAATEKVCKPMFIRTAKEFFKPAKPKAQLNATIANGEGIQARSASVGTARPMDAERLADLARPRQVLVAQVEAELAATPMKRELDRIRVLELSLPRQRPVSEAPAETRCASLSRSLNLARLEDLAKPRQLQMEIETDGNDQKEVAAKVIKALDPRRLLELALPRKAAEADESGTEPAKLAHGARRRASRPRRRKHSLSAEDKQNISDDLGAEAFCQPCALPTSAWREKDRSRLLNNQNATSAWMADESLADGFPQFSDTPRSVDEARLAELATPRKKPEEDKTVPCKCPPKRCGRRRRTKLRILAMVQDRQQAGEEGLLQQDDITDPPDRVMSAGELGDSFDRDGVLDLPERVRSAGDQVETPGSPHVGDFSKKQASSHALDDEAQTPLSFDDDLPNVQPDFDSLDEHVRQSEDRAKSFSPCDMSTLDRHKPGEDVKKALIFSAPPRANRCPDSALRPALEEVLSAEVGQELRLEPKPRSRAVARARSLGAAGLDAENRGNSNKGCLGAVPGGLGARSPLPFSDLEIGGSLPTGWAKRPNLPIGLPRGVSAAVSAAARGGGASAGGPMWKAVPIKVMQFDFCGL
jgi:hypothetical protein